jgi:hypothetical protein
VRSGWRWARSGWPNSRVSGRDLLTVAIALVGDGGGTVRRSSAAAAAIAQGMRMGRGR